MELTLEQRQIAIAMVDYLREMGYILAPAEVKELNELRELNDSWVNGKTAAGIIGCSQTQVTRLKKSKKLKYKMVGSKPLYSVNFLRQFNKNRTIG